MNLLILTTKQNHQWVSMQEIIPSLENLWCNLENIEAVVVNVDEMSFPQLAKLAIKADAFVATAFNATIAKTIGFLRKGLGLKQRILFHLHNQATIGLWPLFQWKIGELINSNDCFLGTCEGDRKSLEMVFDNCWFEKVPFCLEPIEPREPSFKLKGKVPLTYVGRISVQKNIHTMLLSLSLIQNELREYGCHLNLFGGEDNLGNPNMESPPVNYLEYLENLILELNIGDLVTFHGFKPREELEFIFKNNPQIMINTSIHSDENFGMAIFRCLAEGHQVVASSWGGHREFLDHFENIKLVPVYSSNFGPWICATEMGQRVLEEIKNFSKAEPFLPEHFKKIEIIKKLQAIVEQNESEAMQIKDRGLMGELLIRREKFLSDYGCKIFDTFEDPLSAKFFKVYGADAELVKKGDRLVPWVSKNGDIYLVKDPHRGEFEIKELSTLKKSGWVIE